MKKWVEIKIKRRMRKWWWGFAKVNHFRVESVHSVKCERFHAEEGSPCFIEREKELCLYSVTVGNIHVFHLTSVIVSDGKE